MKLLTLVTITFSLFLNIEFSFAKEFCFANSSDLLNPSVQACLARQRAARANTSKRGTQSTTTRKQPSARAETQASSGSLQEGGSCKEIELRGDEAEFETRCVHEEGMITVATLYCENGVQKTACNYEKATPLEAPTEQTSIPQGFSCSALQSQYQQCVQEVQSATNICDQDKNSSLGSAKSVVSSLGTAGNVMGVVNACDKIGQAVTAAQAGFAAFKTDCEAAQTKCLDSCQNILKQINSSCMGATVADTEIIQKNSANAVGSNIESCQKLAQKTMEAETAIAMTLKSAMQASNCSKDAGGTGQNQVVATDCSNPQIAATDLVCVCSKNPQDQRCSNVSSKLGFSGNRNMAATNLNSNSPANIGDMSLEDSTNMASLGKGEKVTGEDPGGKMGGSGVGDDGGVSPNGMSAGNTQYGEDPSGKTNINNGFIGNSGSGGSSFYGGSGGGGRSYPGVNDGFQRGANVDYSKFMPGKYDPKRNIAGAIGAGGLTGPNSMIWDKISNRYRMKMSSLRP